MVGTMLLRKFRARLNGLRVANRPEVAEILGLCPAFLPQNTQENQSQKDSVFRARKNILDQLPEPHAQRIDAMSGTRSSARPPTACTERLIAYFEPRAIGERPYVRRKSLDRKPQDSARIPPPTAAIVPVWITRKSVQP